MAITVARQETTRSSTATSHDIAYPSGIQSGDLVVAFLSFDANPTITMPAGWEELARYSPSNTGVVYVLKADSAFSGTFSVTTSTSEPVAAMVYRVRGTRLNYKYEATDALNQSGVVDLPSIEQYFQPVEVLMISSFLGFSSGSYGTISDYPYANAVDFNSGATGTTQTGMAICHELKTTSHEEPQINFSSAQSGLRITFMFFEEELQSIQPQSAVLGTVGSAIATVVGYPDNVLFDGNTPDLVTVLDDNRVLFTYPSSDEVETVPVRISLDTPHSPAYFDTSFHYTLPAPSLFEVTPPGSALDTTQEITIKGERFRDDSTVEIDGITCDDIVVVDEETITCTVPASAVQKVATLKVTAGDGSEVKTNFFYMDIVPTPPTKTKVRARFIVEPIDYIQ